MKHLLTLFLTVIISVTLFSQINTGSGYNIVEYYLGDSITSSNEICGLAKLDTTFIFAINGSDSLVNYKLLITKTDRLGNIIKTIEFANDTIAKSTYPGNCIIVDSDSNIVVASNNWHTNTNFWDGYVVKLNSNLDTIWTKVISLPDSLAGCSNVGEFLTVVRETPDGNYILAGNFDMNCTYDPAGLRTYLLKLDKNGNVLWWKAFQNFGTTYDITVAPDSGFYIPVSINNNSLNIVKIDSMGNIEWISPSVNSHSSPSYPMSAELMGSEFLIVGSVFWYGGSENLRALTVAKVNTQTKQVVWEKDYYPSKLFKCPTLHQNFDIEVLPNDDIIIAGTATVVNFDSTNSGPKGILLKLNSNGDSLWCRYYGIRNFEDNCQFNDLVLTDDGGFLVGGYHFPGDFSYNYGAWLVKTDSLGFAPGAQTMSIHQLETLGLIVKTYPNPASDYINIQFEQVYKQDLALDIYNALGQRIYQSIIPKLRKEVNVDLKGFERGMFILVIRDGYGIIGSGKFVKD